MIYNDIYIYIMRERSVHICIKTYINSDLYYETNEKRAAAVVVAQMLAPLTKHTD